MAAFTVSETRTYSQNIGDVTDYTQSCGWDFSDGNRVIRFTFTTDSTGANSIHWKVSKFYPWDWQQGNYQSTPIPLNFYIGTDPDSHKFSGAEETRITGEVSIYLSPNGISEECYLSGAAEIKLLPNTTYYLWIFPA